jgi:hypothetical protein
MEKKRVLTLHLKQCWFEEIKSGLKPFEYRAASEYWRKRLVGREYDEVHLMLGYPTSNDADRIIRRKFNGVFPAVVSNHSEFGTGQVPVYAIDVSVKIKS